MDTIIRPDGGKWKTVALVAVAVGCVALLAVVLVRAFGSPRGFGEARRPSPSRLETM